MCRHDLPKTATLDISPLFAGVMWPAVINFEGKFFYCKAFGRKRAILGKAISKKAITNMVRQYGSAPSITS